MTASNSNSKPFSNGKTIVGLNHFCLFLRASPASDIYPATELTDNIRVHLAVLTSLHNSASVVAKAMYATVYSKYWKGSYGKAYADLIPTAFID